jgi:hypothetical protein
MKFCKFSMVPPAWDFINNIGTKRKCHRRLATSAFEGLTDLTNVIADFRF